MICVATVGARPQFVKAFVVSETMAAVKLRPVSPVHARVFDNAGGADERKRN